MSGALKLAWRYLTWHWVRSLILVVSITLVFLLPLTVSHLMDAYAAGLRARADATPLLVGARGSRYDLVLQTLYFRGRVPRPTSMAEADRIQDSDLADAIPLLARHTAQGRPVVGTSHDYYALRRLRAAAGTLPRLMGECVLGADAARALTKAPGDSLLSDRKSIYEFGLDYPLRMRVAGVLAPNGTADDGAVFVDVRTAWVMEGIGHGHSAAEDVDDTKRTTRNGVHALSPVVIEYAEITEDNAGRFHFHGDPSGFPLTGVIVIPRSAKGATLLKARYRVSDSAQMLSPSTVVDEMLGFVFQLKRFFDANVVLVSVATGLLLVLVVWLSLRVRREEIETLHRIGCARSMVFRILSIELLIILGAALMLATGLAALLVKIGLSALLP